MSKSNPHAPITSRGSTRFGATQEERNQYVRQLAAQNRSKTKPETAAISNERELTEKPSTPPSVKATKVDAPPNTPTPRSAHDAPTADGAEDLAMFEVDIVEVDTTPANAIKAIRTGPPDSHTFVRMQLVATLRCVVMKVYDGRYPRKEYYLATKEVACELPIDADEFSLYLWVARDGSFGATLVSLTARDPYAIALRSFAEGAVAIWQRFTRDTQTSSHVSVAAANDFGAPTFPVMTKQKVINLVFGDRRLTSVDHEVVRALKGLA